MFKKEYPFVFTLDYPKESYMLGGMQLNFYKMRIDNKWVLIGIYNKSESKKLQQEIILNLLDLNETWNQDELKSIQRFRIKKQRSRLYEWISSRVLIKYGLLFYFKDLLADDELKPNDIIICLNSSNKPSIELLPQDRDKKFKEIPYISISHTNNTVFVVLSPVLIGIDIEVITKHSESWQEKITGQKELNQVKRLMQKGDFNIKDISYTIIWALKESTLKVNGNNPLGILPLIVIETNDDRVITEIPNRNKKYQNYISILGDSVCVITF